MRVLLCFECHALVVILSFVDGDGRSKVRVQGLGVILFGCDDFSAWLFPVLGIGIVVGDGINTESKRQWFH